MNTKLSEALNGFPTREDLASCKSALSWAQDHGAELADATGQELQGCREAALMTVGAAIALYDRPALLANLTLLLAKPPETPQAFEAACAMLDLEGGNLESLIGSLESVAHGDPVKWLEELLGGLKEQRDREGEV